MLITIALLAAGMLGCFRAHQTVASKSAGELGKLVVTFFEMPQHGIAIAVALEVEVLSPPKDFLKQPKGVEYEINDNSVVLRVRHGRNVFLFTGDIGELAQDYLLETIGAEKLKCTVLAVPHHGFDCYERFASLVKPAVVVASCLKDYPRDNIRSPGQKTTDVYGPVGAQVYVTAWHGSVQVTSDGEICTVKTDRTP